MPHLQLSTWVEIAGLVAGLAAAIAIMKDLRLLFFRRPNRESAVESKLQKYQSVSLLTAGSAAAAGAIATELLHDHDHVTQGHQNLSSQDSLHLQTTDVETLNDADLVPDVSTIDASNLDAASDGASAIAQFIDGLKSIFIH
jgi:hypothetical protein